jgi:hypothetical protein
MKKEGRLIELVDEYLDPTIFDRSIVKSIDKTSINLIKDQKEFEIKEIEKECILRVEFSGKDGVDFESSIWKQVDRTEGITFNTIKGTKDLKTGSFIESEEGIISKKRVGSSRLGITIKDALKEPAESSKMNVIKCRCSSKRMTCQSISYNMDY